ncbi:hypothetical protein GCM10008922_16000 [Faecalicatena contorta]
MPAGRDSFSGAQWESELFRSYNYLYIATVHERKTALLIRIGEALAGFLLFMLREWIPKENLIRKGKRTGRLPEGNK